MKLNDIRVSRKNHNRWIKITQIKDDQVDLIVIKHEYPDMIGRVFINNRIKGVEEKTRPITKLDEVLK
jgi:chemotaxis response regulator CheB